MAFKLKCKRRKYNFTDLNDYLFLIFVTETISRTDEGQPRPKYIFNKCETNIYFFTLHRFAPSPSLNFRLFFSPKLFSERFGKYVNLPLEHVYHVFSFRSLHTPGHNSPYPGTLALQTLSSQLSKQTIDFLFFITFSLF